jgi:hypothetical protein
MLDKIENSSIIFSLENIKNGMKQLRVAERTEEKREY